MKSEPLYWKIDKSNFNPFLMKGSKAVGLQMSHHEPPSSGNSKDGCHPVLKEG